MWWCIVWTGDQLESERVRVTRIADRCDIAHRVLYVTTVGDSHNSKGLELQLVPQFELRVAPGVEEHLTMHANCTCLDTVYCHFTVHDDPRQCEHVLS